MSASPLHDHCLHPEVNRLLAAETLAHTCDRGKAIKTEESLGDDTWLATVAILLGDEIGDFDEAVVSIETNRDLCLVVRRGGFAAFEMAEYAAARIAAEQIAAN
ncbi:hypothetical protein E8D34_17050 [Nocardioides sp. GY 10113]|uniref:hypothetical protein n=1 Tax=Nocardioides sp. GY 10113 TaxID=2569761 RepID=UPI0010A799B6|nr:hypothetical protein [Nocardioides sp. GY 10113]TIC82192.1 hypothetical protein E8D34_17050 [Nocardioides sp. GY 10113]